MYSIIVPHFGVPYSALTTPPGGSLSSPLELEKGRWSRDSPRPDLFNYTKMVSLAPYFPKNSIRPENISPLGHYHGMAALYGILLPTVVKSTFYCLWSVYPNSRLTTLSVSPPRVDLRPPLVPGESPDASSDAIRSRIPEEELPPAEAALVALGVRHGALELTAAHTYSQEAGRERATESKHIFTWGSPRTGAYACC